MANALLRSVFDIRVATLTSFYRVYSFDLLTRIQAAYPEIIEEPGYISMTEVLIKAIRVGARIIEVPTRILSEKRAGTSKMKIVSTALSYLREFPFDRIKIDGGMIAEVKPDSPSNRIVAAMIGLAGSLGMDMNAEGVENETQLDFVREFGCREVQGYLFSPPLPLNLATDLLSATEGTAAQLAGIKLIAG